MVSYEPWVKQFRVENEMKYAFINEAGLGLKGPPYHLTTSLNLTYPKI